jgi:microcystin-dependent protein
MQPYIGQLILASWSYQTTPFVFCNGQTLPINQYQALFSLLGTTFGGDGRTNFMLPNLQGRTPVGVDVTRNITTWGQRGGEDFHTLVANEVPAHTHVLNSTPGANSNSPSGTLPGSGGVMAYAAAANLGAMNIGTLTTVGGSQAHENRQPFLVMNWLIALNGLFPSRS